MRQVHFGSTATGSPDTPEWHAWRAAGIGGSDTMAFLDDLDIPRPTWAKSKNALWLQKTGRGVPIAVNAAMKRGKEGEEPARMAYEAETGNVIQPAFGEAEFWSTVRSSLDGLTFMADLVTEVKCPSAKVHALAKAGQVVAYYQPQLAHQAMVVWGHPEVWPNNEVHFWSYVPETGDGALVVVPAWSLRPMAEKLLAAEWAFWTSVEADAPPCGEEFEMVARQFLVADREFEEAKSAKEVLRGRLIDLAGETGRVEGGGVAVSRKVGTLDYVAAAAALNIEESVLSAYRPTAYKQAVDAALQEGLLDQAFLSRFKGDVDYAAAFAALQISDSALVPFRADDGGYVVSVVGKRAKKEAAACGS